MSVAPDILTDKPKQYDASVLDHAWKTYSAIGEWVRFADTKAGVILATNGALGAIAASGFSSTKDYFKTHSASGAILMLAVVVCVVSSYFALACLTPILSVNSRISKIGVPLDSPFGSMIFFGEITKAFKTHAEYHAAAGEIFLVPERVFEHLTQQIHANSKVAVDKYKDVTIAMTILSVAILLVFAATIVAFFETLKGTV